MDKYVCVGVLEGLSAATKSLPGSCCVHLDSLTKALGSLVAIPCTLYIACSDLQPAKAYHPHWNAINIMFCRRP